MSDSLWPHGLYSPWNSSGQNTGVGSLSLLQGIFPTQGLNPSLLHCRWILYQLSHKGSPRILEWVAYPSRSTRRSSGSSQSRNWTRVSVVCKHEDKASDLWIYSIYFWSMSVSHGTSSLHILSSHPPKTKLHLRQGRSSLPTHSSHYWVGQGCVCFCCPLFIF